MIISYSGIRETTCKILNIIGIQYEEKVLKPGINFLQFDRVWESGYYFIKVGDPIEISKEFIVK